MKEISSKLTHFIAVLCLCMVHLGCETEEEAVTASEVGAESTEEEGEESTEEEGSESTEEEGGESTEDEGGEDSQCEDADCGAAAFQPTPCWDGYEPGVTCESNDAGTCEWVVEDCSENPCDLLECDESNETCEVVDGQAYCVKEDPCYNLECGDSCSTCPPGEDCVGGEYCNAEGQCFPGEPTCGEDLCADFIPPCSNNDECPGDMICSFEGCNPSQAECDPETGAIGGTDDCGGGVCVEATADLCADFIPPCSNNDECPGDMICSFEGCNPSQADCDPETGAIGGTDDCGGGVCVEATADLCADFIPPCSDNDECPGDMVCSFEGCNPSQADCDPETGAIGGTDDCGGGVCVEATADLCADFIPPCSDNDECPGDMICSFEGCNPSSASCDPETGEVTITKDCGGGVCILKSGNPCDGLSCGDVCDTCPPDAPCPGVMEYCNAEGQCTSQEPLCEGDFCADFIPPCQNDEGCPNGMTCSFEGCNPSNASCDPETGAIISTDDCGGGVCILESGNPCDGLSCGDVCDTCPPDAPCPGVMEYCNAEGQCTSQEPLCEGDFCADFIPPCQNDEGCPNGMICSFEGCNPSNASCDPETGAIISTDDCGGGQCVMGCEPGSSVPAADGCNTCICPESGNPAEAISCTEMACEQGTCMSSEDCNDNEFCDFADDTCGVFGEMGTCAPQPKDCGSLFTQGFCGCDGSTTGNPCQMAATGQDIFKYGGCDNLSSGTSFLCGEIQCLNDSWCSIEFNEDPGPFEPDYFTSCIPLDDSQTQGDCTTFFPGALATCFDDGNFTIIFSTYE